MTQALPRLRQLSQEIGVSTATLSRVLNGHPSVSEKTRLKVLKALQEKGYRHGERKKMAAAKHALAFAIPSKTWEIILKGDALYSRHLAGFQMACAAAGYYPVLINHEQDILPDGGLKCVREARVCGVVGEHLSPECLEVIKKEVPVVILNGHSHVSLVDSVVPDIAQAVWEQMDLLYHQGHRSIAHFRITFWENWQARLFWSEFASHGRLRGLSQPPEYFEPIVFGYNGEDEAIEIFLNRVLSCPAPPTAILTFDTYANPIMESCLRRGLKVPEDISIIGYDDIPIRQPLVPLTTCRQAFESMAAEAVRLIRERQAEPDFPSRTVAIKGEMILRDSVAHAKKR